jgi:hypothetical protein
MTFNWSTLATLAILCATIHWIIARSQVMEWLWAAPWLPDFISDLLTCPACSGFWLGLGLGAVGFWPLITDYWWLNIPATGLAGVWCTPIAEGILLWGLEKSKIH